MREHTPRTSIKGHDGILTSTINVTSDGRVDQSERVADGETHGRFTRLMDAHQAMLWRRIAYEMPISAATPS